MALHLFKDRNPIVDGLSEQHGRRAAEVRADPDLVPRNRAQHVLGDVQLTPESGPHGFAVNNQRYLIEHSGLNPGPRLAGDQVAVVALGKPFQVFRFRIVIVANDNAISAPDLEQPRRLHEQPQRAGQVSATRSSSSMPSGSGTKPRMIDVQ